jgi:hypothetical protein
VKGVVAIRRCDPAGCQLIELTQLCAQLAKESKVCEPTASKATSNWLTHTKSTQAKEAGLPELRREPKRVCTSRTLASGAHRSASSTILSKHSGTTVVEESVCMRLRA